MRHLSLRRSRPQCLSLEQRLTPATLPSGYTEAPLTADAVSSGTAMEFSPAGKLFVTQQGGLCKVYSRNGNTWTLDNANFLANTPITTTSSGERGLLSVAFDPGYATNHFVYFYYTATTPAAHNRIIRVTAQSSGASADVATVAGSTVTIMDLPNLSSATNHNGGAMHFGADGKLYVAVGDNANSANSQSMSTVLGKLLRINADGTIPSDNPFLATTTGQNQAIWALGLRNPYTFAFRPGTNSHYINDVGENTWEEINPGVAGANYGWPTTEGRFNQASFPNFTEPLVAYHHSTASLSYPTPGYTGAAITGGAFYSPSQYFFPADNAGDYFFADYVNGFIRRFDEAENTVYPFATNAGGPVDLEVTSDGGLLYLSRNNSAVYFVRYNPGPVVNVASVVVDDNTAQRSMVRSLTVNFSGTVTFAGTPAAAFSLVGPGGAVTVVPSAIDNSSGHSVVTLTFSGTGQALGSLANGDYTLTVLGDQLRDPFGRFVDADGDGVPRGNFTKNFHRLYGDSNGDRVVDLIDFLVFRTALGSSSPSYFDNDGNGQIDLNDFLAFRAALGGVP